MPDISSTFPRNDADTMSIASLAGVLLLHLVALWILISLDVVPNPLPIRPLIVQILQETPRPASSAAARPSAPSKAPRPKTPAKQPAPLPTLAAQTNVLSAEVQERPVTQALPPIRSAPAEAALSQPRFDADYLDNPVPDYPPISRRMGEEGKVFLRVLVEADGRASRVEIKTSSGSPRLDQAAEQAVRRWRFIPAKHGNEAVSAWVVVPVSFNLKG